MWVWVWKDVFGLARVGSDVILKKEKMGTGRDSRVING